MKMFRLLAALCLTGTIAAGCVKKQDGENGPQPGQPVRFDWKTTRQVTVNIVSDNAATTPVFIYSGNVLAAAGYTPFNEKITVPVSATKLSVTTFPKDPSLTKAYAGDWIWPLGQVVDVPLANGSTITVPGLIDLHADIFVKWNGWQLTGNNWASFVDYWNAGATQNSSIVLYPDKKPFTADDGFPDVGHSCLWPQCRHGAPVGGTSTAVGTYLFEDLFPSMGDYDMNDMVAGEYSTTTVGADNKVKRAELVYKINAVGSGVDMAMAVALPKAKTSDIAKVELFRIDAAGAETPYECANSTGLFDLRDGVEVSGTDEVVIPLFDNIRTLLVQATAGKFFNTMPGGGQGEPLQIKINIEFKAGSAVAADGLTDLFIMPKTGESAGSLEKWRGHEVHLADSKPTAKMDMSLFGTGDTADDKSAGYRTFRNKDGYVWAIYLPVADFRHPVENSTDSPNRIYDSYPRFKTWIENDGTTETEWYLHPVTDRVWSRN